MFFKLKMIKYLQSLFYHFILKHIKKNEFACSNYLQKNINVDDILSNVKYVQKIIKHENKVIFMKNIYCYNKSCHKY